MTGDYEDAKQVLDALERLGISYADVVALLEREGVDKFEKSWDELLADVQEELTKAATTTRTSRRASDERRPRRRRLPVRPRTRSRQHVPALVEDRFASRLFAQDATLWGPDAESEAAIRLSWVGLPRSSRPLVGEVAALRDAPARAEGVDHVVLCGMGGSSLAPEVICATAGVELTVLDSSDPDYVRAALADRLDRTVVVVSSKSGSTVETDSQRRAYEAAFTEAGIDPTARIVVVTDPGSPLDEEARAAGYRVVNADPNVGGRYSALTAFGLVPSGLAGVDIEALLDEAESVADLLAEDDEANPGLRLGAAMAGTDAAARQAGHRSTTARASSASPTGPSSSSPSPPASRAPASCPSSSADADDPEVRWPAADVTVVRLVGDADDDASAAPPTATRRAPRSTSAAPSAPRCCCGRSPPPSPAACSASTRSTSPTSRAPRRPPAACSTPPAARDARAGLHRRRHRGPRPRRRLARRRPATVADGARRPVRAAGPAPRLRRGHGLPRPARRRRPRRRAARRWPRRTGRPTTFGWGPRFLHSTGQFHKGGPATGVYLQITTAPARGPRRSPGATFTFGDFIAAQAGGDAQVLADHGRPVLRLHLTDHDAGLAQLAAVLRPPSTSHRKDDA